MDHFYDNNLQSGLMRDLALDLEVLGESVILLGNQARIFPSSRGMKLIRLFLVYRVLGKIKSSTGELFMVLGWWLHP